MRHLSIFALLALGCSDLDGDGARDGADCEPEDPGFHPEAAEVCDGRDNDCDGQIDEDVAFVAYWDRDLDGWGDANFARRVCALPADGSLTAGDCDDFDATVFPDAEELCDLADNNCDDAVDEGVGATFYVDADGDGFGDPTAPSSSGCFVPSGHASTDDDCDDANADSHPGAAELCDGQDNDCDLEIDEGLTTTRVWADVDGDGYGDPNAPTLGCGTGDGVADNDLDCDDLDPTLSPDALDVRGDDLDADCDSYIDEYGVGPLNEFATVEEALASAPDGAVVQLDAGFFVGTVDLRGHNVTFAGEGCERTTWYADGAASAVIVDAGTVERMTISGGAGSIEATGDQNLQLLVGGGIAVAGDATIRSACLTNNSADAGGGIAVVAGTATIDDTLVLRNSAVVDGGGIYVSNPAVATVVRSRLIANVAGGRGGGLHARGGTATVTNTVIAANQADKHGSGGSGSAAGTKEAALVFDQVTFHDNQSVRTNDANGQAVFLAGANANAVHTAAVLHNVLITGHSRDFTLVESTTGGVFTKTFVGYRGNAGADADFDVPQPDRIGREIAYILDDPSVAPEQWDLRMRSSSQFIDRGDPAVLDPDGTVSDVGAYGGPGAPTGWDYGQIADDDYDGMLSGYELHKGLNPWVFDRTEDPDGDTLENGDEANAGAHPFVVDTDGDGVDDVGEVRAMTLPYDARDQAPLADAGYDRYGVLGEPVWLDAGASADPNGDPLTFTWTVDVIPPFSSLTLANPAAERFALVPDAVGTYELTLTVSDGKTARSTQVEVHAFDGPIVPDDAATLADAVAMVLPGQAIGVRPGTWPAAVDLGANETVIIGLVGEGTADDVVLDGQARGSVLRSAGELTIAQLTLTGGYAPTGGGLHVDAPDGEVGTPTLLADVVIRDNFAAEGGGLWVSGTSTKVELDDVRIVDNVATVQGGGALIGGYFILPTLTAHRTSFLGNTAPKGGALFTDGGGVKTAFVNADSNFLLYGCTFAGNSAEHGAVFHHSGVGSDLMIENATFVGNRGGSLGIALDGRVTLKSDILARNEVDLLWDGVAETQHHQGMWQDFDRAAVWGDNVDGIQAADDLVTWNVVDPLLARFTDDGDATDDLWVHLIGSPAVDAGFIDDTDRDGSRSDAGACSGPHALARCQAFAFDAELDGLADGWESAVGLDPTVADALVDHDGDGLDALAEMDGGTDPFDADSDEDGIVDSLDDDPRDDRDHRPQIVADRWAVTDVSVPVAIDAAASFDPDGDPLSFAWRVVSAPPGSSETLSDADAPTATFSGDAPGTWVLEVTASDADATSRPYRVWVHVRDVLQVHLDGSGDFATVDEAIDAATVGDVVALGPGEWSLHLTGQDFPVELVGAGMDETFITPVDESTQVVVGEFDTLALRDLTLADGLGVFGGGLSCIRGAVDLVRVRILRAVASRGGAVYLEDCTATFTDVELLDNQAAFQGGGVSALGGTLDWVGGQASRNRSTNGGGALNLSSVDAVVRNVVFAENRVLFLGSAIGIETGEGREDGVLVGDHLTFVNNTGITNGAIGRRISSPVTVRNSIFVGNAPNAVYDAASDKVDLTLDHNLYWANQDEVWTSAQIGTDNLFVDPRLAADGSYRLTHTSPARGAGSDLDPDGSLGDLGAFGGPDARPGWDAYWVDADGDGMADAWELAAGLDSAFPDDQGDPDLDGVLNLDEQLLLTDPYQEDSDADGVWDAEEIATGDDPTDPLDHAPEVDAGKDITLAEGELAVLDADSDDAQGDPVAFLWTLADQPGRSALTDSDLVGADTDSVSFTPDVPGAYVLRVIGNDGAVDGPPDEVAVSVIGEIFVPEDYPSVAEAVAAAPSGSTIHIGPGVWPARVDFAKKDLELVGAGNGEDGTVLDGEGLGTVVTAANYETVTLTDLTLTGGRGGRGGGLWYFAGNLLKIERVSFEGNIAADGGGMHAEGGFASVSIADSRFVDNVAAYRGGGLSTSLILNLAVDRTLFAGNRAPNDLGGGLRVDRGTTRVSNAVFSDNEARMGGAVSLTGASNVAATVTLDHITATYNEASDAGAFIKVLQLCNLTLSNSVVAYNREVAAVDWNGALNTYTQTYSLFSENDPDYVYPAAATPPSDGDANGNIMPYDPGLADTTDDGDWTNETWWLVDGSAGQDAADPASPLDPDATAPDMGAFGGEHGDWVP